ncbi:cingulin-like protein 1 [Paramormyrops kingsleyae]|uniref:cingulin-like protein 1 n=1 Tax=Paramormyrops kingsleyae TaxID=1676925 RepID=UPI003B976D49
MASHKVGSIPGQRLQCRYRGNDQSDRVQSNGNSVYGLSVRVQGIDGHPFVILNKQDTESQDHRATDRNGDMEGSFLDNYQDYDFTGRNGVSRSHDPFVEYRSQKQKALLNFQRHPELLKPYDPESNALGLGDYQSRSSRPASLVEPSASCLVALPRATSPVPSHSRNVSPNQSTIPPPPNDISAPRQPTRSCVSSSTTSSSASSSLERGRPSPNVLPLRRHGSSGPVLEPSTSSSTHRPPSNDQLEALYADSINRHENRRYIPFLPGTGRDIDTGSIPGVDELINKFDGKDAVQRRGRAGHRNRIGLEERKRSRSVDSALAFRLSQDEKQSHKDRSVEHQLRPSQLQPPRWTHHRDPRETESPSSLSSVQGKPNLGGSPQDSSDSSSPQGTSPIATTSVLGYKRVVSRSFTKLAESPGDEAEKSLRSVKVLMGTTMTSSSKPSGEPSKRSSAESRAQVTPDLLKGQQELSQQTHEETAKQILFNYLKDGSTDNDDATKRKVNLVFEKIQTLKSRAAGNMQDSSQSSEVARELKELQTQKEELEKNISELKKLLKEKAERLNSLAAVFDKEVAERETMKEELSKRHQESTALQEKLSEAVTDLRSTTEVLLQVKLEREQCQKEVRDLQEQLSEMHDELDGAKRAVIDLGEKDAIIEDMMQMKLDFQDVLLLKEEQEELLRRRERELTALKGALKEEVATHDKEVDTMRAQYEQEICKLQTVLQEARQGSAAVCQEKADLEAARGEAAGRAQRLAQDLERLRRREHELENTVAELNHVIDEAKLKESLLSDRVARLEREKGQLDESVREMKGKEEEMSQANSTLATRLEDKQRDFTKLSQDHTELSSRLREEQLHKEQLRRSSSKVEDERNQLGRAMEKLQKELSDRVKASQTSAQELQGQLEELKEKSRREHADLHKQHREKVSELEQSQQATRRLQEKLSSLEEELRVSREELEGAEQKGRSLEQRVQELELEVEAKARAKDERSRQIKLLEEKISQLELDLEEERGSGDLLMERLERGKEQLDQIRSDLLQERAAKQDLECDKIALERQNKDLRSRVAHLEASQKSSKGGMVPQLEERVQELEQRLEVEERDRANLQLANRRLERKVKEMMMQVDDEHHSLQDQKDQLNLRLKTLKRQMDEAEEEIERLEHGKKKLQRELEEQLETNEELQVQIKALRSEMRRKSTSAPILNDLGDDEDEDDISTDGEAYYSSGSGSKRSVSAAIV